LPESNEAAYEEFWEELEVICEVEIAEVLGAAD
jgi:hypothetical protein